MCLADRAECISRYGQTNKFGVKFSVLFRRYATLNMFKKDWP
jgi:hypothetical protein